MLMFSKTVNSMRKQIDSPALFFILAVNLAFGRPTKLFAAHYAWAH